MNANSQTQQVKANQKMHQIQMVNTIIWKGFHGANIRRGLIADGHTYVRVMEAKGQVLNK